MKTIAIILAAIVMIMVYAIVNEGTSYKQSLTLIASRDSTNMYQDSTTLYRDLYLHCNGDKKRDVEFLEKLGTK